MNGVHLEGLAASRLRARKTMSALGCSQTKDITVGMGRGPWDRSIHMWVQAAYHSHAQITWRGDGLIPVRFWHSLLATREIYANPRRSVQEPFRRGHLGIRCFNLCPLVAASVGQRPSAPDSKTPPLHRIRGRSVIHDRDPEQRIGYASFALVVLGAAHRSALQRVTPRLSSLHYEHIAQMKRTCSIRKRRRAAVTTYRSQCPSMFHDKQIGEADA